MTLEVVTADKKSQFVGKKNLSADRQYTSHRLQHWYSTRGSSKNTDTADPTHRPYICVSFLLHRRDDTTQQPLSPSLSLSLLLHASTTPLSPLRLLPPLAPVFHPRFFCFIFSSSFFSFLLFFSSFFSFPFLSFLFLSSLFFSFLFFSFLFFFSLSFFPSLSFPFPLFFFLLFPFIPPLFSFLPTAAQFYRQYHDRWRGVAPPHPL